MLSTNITIMKQRLLILKVINKYTDTSICQIIPHFKITKFIALLTDTYITKAPCTHFTSPYYTMHTHENKHCNCAARGGLRSGVINFGPQTGLCAAKQPVSTDTGLFEPHHLSYQLPLNTTRPGSRSTDCSLYQNWSSFLV